MINVINDLSDANVDGSAPQSRLVWLTEWLLKRLWVFTAVTLLLLTLTNTLSLLARHHWVADLCANLRTQQAIAIAGIMLVVILYRRWRWLALSAVLMLIHFPWYVSAIVGAADADQPADMVVMVINVLTSNRNFHMIEEQIAEASPDALAVLEIGTPLARTLEKSLGTTYPHQICLPQDDGNFGIALYSRYPLSQVERITLNVSSIETLAATASKDEKEYRIVATHPLPPLGTSGFTERNEHLQRLATRVTEFRSQHSDISMIVVGDLNLTPWSPLFSDLEAATGLTRAGKGYGVTPTWYGRFESLPTGLVLDHCLISEDLICVSHSVGANFGSDHRAIVVGLKSRK